MNHSGTVSAECKELATDVDIRPSLPDDMMQKVIAVRLQALADGLVTSAL